MFAGFGIRAFSTLLFDIAYDLGGLPLSTAVHTWFNTIDFTLEWAASSGMGISDDGGAVALGSTKWPIGVSVFWVKNLALEPSMKPPLALTFSFVF
jgi:hypothetical protein